MPKEREVFNAYKTRKAAYVALQDKLADIANGVDFSTAETMELTADALSMLYSGESESAFVATAETLGELQKINADAALRANEEAKTVFSAARAWVLGTLALCVALAAVLGVAITRAVTRPAHRRVGRPCDCRWRSGHRSTPAVRMRWASCSTHWATCGPIWRGWCRACEATPKA